MSLEAFDDPCFGFTLGLVLGGGPSKIEVIRALGVCITYNLCISPTCISPKTARFFEASKLPNLENKKTKNTLGNLLMDINKTGFLQLIFFQIMATLDLHLLNFLQVVSCVSRLHQIPTQKTPPP